MDSRSKRGFPADLEARPASNSVVDDSDAEKSPVSESPPCTPTLQTLEAAYPASPEYEKEGKEAYEDHIVVDWDGPDDPYNPKNWSTAKKWTATAIVSAFTFISPVSSSMIAPATGQIATDFNITNDLFLAMTTSVFVLAYAFGPLILGPLSEIYGRSVVLQLSNVFYLVWNIACGAAQNKNQLIAFRFLAGLGGSPPLAIGGAVLADCWRPDQRGKAVAFYSLGPILGPVLGPVAGAWIAERSSWRWVFWSTSIVDGIILVLGLIFLRESFAPLLLERKANKVRKEMRLARTERNRVRTPFSTEDHDWRRLFSKALVRPFVLLVEEPIIQLLSIYTAFVYGVIYLLLTTITAIYQGVYAQPVGTAGLHYLALGAGLILASQANAELLDRVYVWLRKRRGGAGKPEYRLPSMVPGTIFLPAGLLITGWTARADVHWIAPDIGIALVGAGMILNFQSVLAYIADAYTLYAASAMAAAQCLRSICGFAFPLFAPAMYARLGFGKGDTVLAVLAIVIGCPAPWLFWYYGERLRKKSRHAADPE